VWGVFPRFGLTGRFSSSLRPFPLTLPPLGIWFSPCNLGHLLVAFYGGKVLEDCGLVSGFFLFIFSVPPNPRGLKAGFLIAFKGPPPPKKLRFLPPLCTTPPPKVPPPPYRGLFPPPFSRSFDTAVSPPFSRARFPLFSDRQITVLFSHRSLFLI